MNNSGSRTPGRRGARLYIIVGLALLLLAPISRVRAEITLILFEPVYTDCGVVSINGVAMSDDPDEPVFDLRWDWGDGSVVTSSMFPAVHQYTANGSYTVEATATACHSESETTTVQIVNAEDPECQPHAAARYLFPYSLHLTNGATSATPLRIRDHDGNDVDGATVLFVPSDPTLVTISPDGYVTALREEAAHEIGTWVHATVDGVSAANVSIVRVLSTDHGSTFIAATEERTVLYYPDTINGEDLTALVETYEISTANEYAYGIQTGLMGTTPFRGQRQIFEVDFGEYESQRVCGISGNPVRLGWNVNGNAWQNCFLVPFIPPRSPQWFVFHHELAHNFTWESSAFAQGLGSVVYSEGIASAIAVETMYRIATDVGQFPLGDDARDSIGSRYDHQTQIFRDAMDAWLAGGAEFSQLNFDIVDGLWLHHAETRGTDFVDRFCLPLQPRHVSEVGHVLCGTIALGDQGRHTFFAALVSAAAGEDLSDVFSGTYHYPLDAALFDTAYATFAAIMAPCPADLDANGAVDVVDLLAILAAWGNTGGPHDLDGNGTVDVGDLLAVLAAWGPCA